MTTNPTKAHDLAARLDDVLPPGSDQIHDAPDDDPAIHAAIWLARAPRPVLTAAARDRIEAWVLTGANRVFAPRRTVWLMRGLAAACVLIVALAALWVALSPGDTANPSHHAPALADQAESGPWIAPSSPDTVLIILSDAVAPPALLTEIGGGATSLFIFPAAP
jgi:hypothetical protein